MPTLASTLSIVAVGGSLLLAAGCAKHADFVEMRDQLATVSKSQEQSQRRLDDVSRRMDTLENRKDGDAPRQRFDDLAVRIQKLEARLAKLDESQVVPSIPKLDPVAVEPPRSSKPLKPGASGEAAPLVPGTPGITPTSAFNLAYNDYLNGKYDLAVSGFQRFVREFPGTSLTPNAHYWLGESYYQQKDYVRAMQAFEYVASEFPGNEKVPASLFKTGVAAAETGDLPKAKKSLKRVIEEFPTSDEAKLAKNKLAEIR